MKKLLSLLLSLCLICNMSFSAYAQENANNAEEVIYINLENLDYDSVKSYILSLGITEEEYNNALTELAKEYKKKVSPYSFPSNPVEGQEFSDTTPKIPLALFSGLGIIEGTATLSEVAKAIQAALKGASVALNPLAVIALAGSLISLGASISGYNYIQFEIHYKYGLTNDGVMGWNVGPVYTKLFK